MSYGKAVVPGYFPDKRTHQVRGYYHISRRKNSCQADELAACQACIHTGCDKYIREPVQHVAGKEYGFPFGKTGKEQVKGKGDQHNNTDLGAVYGHIDVRLAVCRRHHGIKCRRQAVYGISGNNPGTL